MYEIIQLFRHSSMNCASRFKSAESDGGANWAISIDGHTRVKPRANRLALTLHPGVDPTGRPRQTSLEARRGRPQAALAEHSTLQAPVRRNPLVGGTTEPRRHEKRTDRQVVILGKDAVAGQETLQGSSPTPSR